MSSKLKMPLSHTIGIFSILFLITLIAEDQLNGTINVLWFWGGAIIVWDFLYAKKTGLPMFYVMGILGGSAAWHYLLATRYESPFTMGTWLLHIVVFVSASFIYPRVKFFEHTAYEKNAFRLFKLASKNVWEASNGFTTRPYPGGNVSIAEQDINKFAGFLYDKNIAKPVFRGGATYLMFSMNTSPLSNSPDSPSLDKVSYAMFDSSGNLSVSISRDDYRQYREKYNFEQLCSSMSDIFMNFFKLYKEGKEYYITEKLNSVKLNLFNW
jgi:hypothetical protein